MTQDKTVVERAVADVRQFIALRKRIVGSGEGELRLIASLETILAKIIAPVEDEGVVRDPWNPDPDDPFWMVEVRQGFDGAGSWLKNTRTFLTTRDPTKALRYPSRFEADIARRSLPLSENGRFEPTEHSWIGARSVGAAT